MENEAIIKTWNEAEKIAKKQEEFLHILDKLLLDNQIEERDKVNGLMTLATNKKGEISESFQNYFRSYAIVAFRQCEYAFDNPTNSNLIPAVYLTHHSVELFIKFVKLDLYTLFGKKWNAINAILPANITDMDLNKHNVINVLDDADCIKWFCYIRDGESLRTRIKRKYDLVCKLLGVDNIAVNMRYPMSKGYQVNDYSYLTEEDIKNIASKSMDLIALCICADFTWAKDDDKRENLQKELLED